MGTEETWYPAEGVVQGTARPAAAIFQVCVLSGMGIIEGRSLSLCVGKALL